MPIQRLPFLADHLAEPFADLWAVDVVIVDPTFVARVVGGIDVDAFYLADIARQQRFEGMEVVALYDQIARVARPPRQFRYGLKQTKRDLVVVLDDRLFANPVQCRHQ